MAAVNKLTPESLKDLREAVLAIERLVGTINLTDQLTPENYARLDVARLHIRDVLKDCQKGARKQ